jgi:hypothetical protein
MKHVAVARMLCSQGCICFVRARHCNYYNVDCIIIIISNSRTHINTITSMYCLSYHTSMAALYARGGIDGQFSLSPLQGRILECLELLIPLHSVGYTYTDNEPIQEILASHLRPLGHLPQSQIVPGVETFHHLPTPRHTK